MKKLREPEEALERFFEIFERMQKKMGPVLIQLPQMVKFNYEITEHLFKLLKESYKNIHLCWNPGMIPGLKKIA